MTQIILNGRPINADVEAAPVGAFDVIRSDIRKLSSVQPVNRVFVERSDVGYRGVMFSNERPFMFALNGNGFISKPIQDGPQILTYCDRLEDEERELTAALEAKRADDEIDAFNVLMGEGSTKASTTAQLEEGPSATLAVWGPPIEQDPIERTPGAYRKMLQGGALSTREGKESEGVCGGGIVLNKDGKVLLVKPRGGWGGYDWTFPKGYPAKVDGGQREQTAMREVREETGYQTIANRFLGRFTHNDGGVCDYFFCDVDGEKPVGQPDPHETGDVKWATLVEALEMLNDDVDVRILACANNLLPKLIIKGGPHSGTMIALYIPADVASKIAIAGGEEPASLHITLAYLGKGLSDDQKKIAANVVRKFAGTIIDGIKVTLGGVGRFSASETTEGNDVVYLSVDSPAITRLHPWLISDLKEAGLPIAETHGFSPHVTLAYIKKTEDTPIKRFEPIELKFDTISLAIADQQMTFPLKLSAENQKWHDVAVRNTQALNLYVQKAERNVDAPGSRGGKFWIDDNNQVRYGVRPANLQSQMSPEDLARYHAPLTAAEKKTCRESWRLNGTVTCPKCGQIGIGVTKEGVIHHHGTSPGCYGGGESIVEKKKISAQEHRDNLAVIAADDAKKKPKKETIYVHKNKMGVRFLRHESEHGVDEETQAFVRYAPFGKNVDGLSEGEVHFIFDELYHSKHKTMDEFLNDRVQPVWDDEGGKNPYTIEKARTWMDHTLTYLEYDNAVAPGGKDVLFQRQDVNWKSVAKAAKKIPRTLFDRKTHDRSISAWIDQVENGKTLRVALRTILSHFGITKPPMGGGGYQDRLCANDEPFVNTPGAIAFHAWSGDVHMKESVHDDFKNFAEAMARDDGKVAKREHVNSVRTLVHEELHGFSEMESTAYQGVGMFVEEIATEVAARYVVRERFGHLRDMRFGDQDRTLSGPGQMTRTDHAMNSPSQFGAYGKIIDECIQLVAETLAARDADAHTKPSHAWHDEAKHTLEQACMEMKRKHYGVNNKTPHQHLDRFVACFKTLTFTEQRKLAAEVELLISSKPGDARH